MRDAMYHVFSGKSESVSLQMYVIAIQVNLRIDKYLTEIRRNIFLCHDSVTFVAWKMSLRKKFQNKNNDLLLWAKFPVVEKLTHWGRVTHICVNKLTTIGSDNGLSSSRRQAIIGTTAGILLIRPLGKKFSEILSEILTFSFKKMRLKVSSAKWRPCCLGLYVLISLTMQDFRKERQVCYPKLKRLRHTYHIIETCSTILKWFDYEKHNVCHWYQENKWTEIWSNACYHLRVGISGLLRPFKDAYNHGEGLCLPELLSFCVRLEKSYPTNDRLIL